MLEFRMPNLTAEKPEAAIREMQEWLFQLKQQLTMALEQMDSQMQQEAQKSSKEAQAAAEAAKKSPGATFGQIKDLIIKSADIVESYSEQISTRMAGRYVAVSDFGKYEEETENRISANELGITQQLSSIQTLQSSVKGLEDAQIEMNAYIRTGKLYEDAEGIPRYGVEIGEQAERDGALAFRKFARLTSDRLSFFDQNETEVAWISDRTLHITEAEVEELTAGSVAARQIAMGDYVIRLGNDGHLTIM